MSEDKMIVLGLAWSLVQIVRTIPALVWSLRCRPTSSGYRCPPIFPSVGAAKSEKPALPGLRWNAGAPQVHQPGAAFKKSG
jgi:hypothetical protein